MEYRVIKIDWKGFDAEVFVCADCEMPKGAESLGLSMFSSVPGEIPCYVCQAKTLNDEVDEAAVIEEAHVRR